MRYLALLPAQFQQETLAQSQLLAQGLQGHWPEPQL
jgi:hypothetical protein